MFERLQSHENILYIFLVIEHQVILSLNYFLNEEWAKQCIFLD